jgi:D-cysteine desulfhydrase/L-cysteate sulfo-lyase
VLTDDFPRVDLAHTPTPLEPMANLSAELGGADIWIKRDDCTGLAMGGNKARQLEFYIGDALAQGADTLLTTGAVQSNHVRMTVAAARKLGLACEVQLEERVAGRAPEYYASGNPFLVRLFGVPIHRYPGGEDEEGADRALHERAAELKADGKIPYVIPLAPGHKPLGALGYVLAAGELLDQARGLGITIDSVVLATGSGSTHAGLLAGLRAGGSRAKVYGFCVRRDRQTQGERVAGRLTEVARMIGAEDAVAGEEVWVDDSVLGPGYGQLTEGAMEAIGLAARLDGILLDPTYTGKAMAGLIGLVCSGELGAGERCVFLHTGGTPALFGYPELTAGSGA